LDPRSNLGAETLTSKWNTLYFDEFLRFFFALPPIVICITLFSHLVGHLDEYGTGPKRAVGRGKRKDRMTALLHTTSDEWRVGTRAERLATS
jgi:hypothetical protein